MPDRAPEKPEEQASPSVELSAVERKIFLQWLGPGSFAWQQDATLSMLHLGVEADKRDSLETRVYEAFRHQFPDEPASKHEHYAKRMKWALDQEDLSETPEEYVRKDAGKAYESFLSEMPEHVREVLSSFSFFEEVGKIPPRVIMRESALISLLSQLEVLMSNLLTAGLSDPETFTAEFGGQTLTWGELLAVEDFASELDRAKTKAVEDKVDIEMRKSFASHLKLFSRLLGNDHATKGADFDFIDGVTLVRNRIIHAGGKPTDETREFLRNHYDLTLDDEDVLVITDDLIQDCATSCFVVAFSLSSACMSKWSTHTGIKESFETRLVDHTFRLLQQGRYGTIANLGDRFKDVTFMRQQNRYIFSVNYWLALKFSDKFDQCVDAVKNWQVDALERQFKLAKLILLDDLESAKNLASAMRESNELSDREWLSWPLLQTLHE